MKHQRITLESWFANLEQTPLNRSQQLPAPYKRLIDEIKQNQETIKETERASPIYTLFHR